MKKLSLSLLALLLISQSFAQRRKTAFVELLGNGLIVSGNFEMRLKKDSNSGSGIRAGLGGGNVSGYDNNGNYVSVGLVTIPLGYNYLIGEKRSSFELGAGITPIIVSANGNVNGDFFSGSGLTLTGVLNAGYRYQPLNSGFMGKITWTPLATNSGFYAAYFGIGLGYSFK
jgi:hypothetical protein